MDYIAIAYSESPTGTVNVNCERRPVIERS